MMYNIGVEFYKKEEETEVSCERFNEFDGIRIATFTCENHTEALEYAKRFITKLMKSSPEFIKATFPNFYRISCTKQFWFHVFMKDVIDKNQLPKAEVELEFDEPSIESNTSNLDESTLDSFDVYIDKDGEEMYNPPERINFWDTI